MCRTKDLSSARDVRDPPNNGGVSLCLGRTEEVFVGDLGTSKGVGIKVLVNSVEQQSGISRWEILDEVFDDATVSSGQNDEVRRATVQKLLCDSIESRAASRSSSRISATVRAGTVKS